MSLNYLHSYNKGVSRNLLQCISFPTGITCPLINYGCSLLGMLNLIVSNAATILVL